MSSQQTVVTETNIPAWVEEGAQDLYNQAIELIGQDYPIYDGPRIAGFNQDELDAFDLVRDSQGVWQPYFDSATDSVNSAGRAYGPIAQMGAHQIGPIDDVSATTVSTDMWDGDAWETYGNPFYDKIINDQIEEIRRQSAQTQSQIGAAAARSGAWGGSRHGVQEAELGRSMQTLINRAINEGDYQAWEQAQRMFTSDHGRKLQADTSNQSALLNAALANQQTALTRGRYNQMAGQYADDFNISTGLNQWNTERDRDLQVGAGLSDLGIMTSDFMTSDANNLSVIGGAARDMDQQNLDLAYGDFMDQYYAPYENLNFASGILAGVPYSRSTTQTSEGGGSNTLGQITGALATGYGLGKEFGWWG